MQRLPQSLLKKPRTIIFSWYTIKRGWNSFYCIDEVISEVEQIITCATTSVDDEKEQSSEDQYSSQIVDDIIYNVQNLKIITSSVDIPEAFHDFVEVCSRLSEADTFSTDVLSSLDKLIFDDINEDNELLFVDQGPWNVTDARLSELANINYATASTYNEHISLLVTKPSAYNWKDFTVINYDLENDINESVKSSCQFILTPSWFWFNDVDTIEDHNEDAFYILSRLICRDYDNFTSTTKWIW